MNDISENEVKLQKLEKRDSAFKTFALLVLGLAVAFTVFTGMRLQQELEVTRKESEIFRAANVERQEKIQDYIKCVVLLRYYEPPVTETSTEAETRAALDSCAEKP